MQLYVALVALLSALFASASPYPGSVARAHRERATLDTSTYCGNWDTVSAGKYNLYLNLWGAAGSQGYQCAQITDLNGDTISWETTYDWARGSGIKSFTNIQLNEGINTQLSAISRMPAFWEWHMSSASIVADVAFDLFTADYPGGPNVNEVMIWLANYHAGPLSYQYTASGRALPIAQNIQFFGHTWRLYAGTNGANQVFSFVLASGTLKNFNEDIFVFLKYLMEHEGLPSTQYLVTAQGGSEASSGHSTLTTTRYSLAIQ